MNKDEYLVTVDFRYHILGKYKDEIEYKSKEIVIGVYKDFNNACKYGNNFLIKMEKKFNLHVFPGGRKAKKERFSKNGGAFGSRKNLITNMAYLKTPFDFFAKITTLHFNNIDLVVDDITDSLVKTIK